MAQGRCHFEGREIVDKSTPPDYVQVPNASIAVYKQGTTTAVNWPIRTASVGGTTRANPYTVSDGQADFFTDWPQEFDLGVTPSGGSQVIWSNLSTGGFDGRKYATTYGALFDNTTDDSAALIEANSTLDAGEVLYLPFGTAKVDADTPLFPYQDGASWQGVGGGGTNRLGGTVLKAKTGANLFAIASTLGVMTNNSTRDTAQGIQIRGVSFFGGGYGAGSLVGQSGTVETTANTLHGVALHGSGIKFKECVVVSANGHGIYLAGQMLDGTQFPDADESHEIGISDCVVRYTGGDGIHGGMGVQDGTISGAEWTKLQYCGGHSICLENAQGWTIHKTHPSWAVGDLINLTSCWQTIVSNNYLGSIGKYRDGMGYVGPHYGIRARGGDINMHDNVLHTNASATDAVQMDAVVPIRLQDFKSGSTHDNTFTYQTGDNVPAFVDPDDIAETHSCLAMHQIHHNSWREKIN